jgi:hypothetical protein
MRVPEVISFAIRLVGEGKLVNTAYTKIAKTRSFLETIRRVRHRFAGLSPMIFIMREHERQTPVDLGMQLVSISRITRGNIRAAAVLR